MKIVLKKGQQIFFTSDTHYNHSNICAATTKWEHAQDVTRPFSSLELMNQTIVDNINWAVGEDDILIHLGDWSFGGFERIKEFRDQIKCKNIHLVLGNHDHHIRNDKDGIRSLFSSVHDYLFLDIRVPMWKNEVAKFEFICMHYPIASWDGMNNGVPHLHGHCHLPPHHRIAAGKAMDIGVDGNGMEPLSLGEIVAIMKNRPIAKLCLPQDHHEKRL